MLHKMFSPQAILQNYSNISQKMSGDLLGRLFLVVLFDSGAWEST